ncbi:MAG: RNA pyrophosphohydrolase [Candidatus Puniceispirillaceae bacterium]|jgi:putative (di)nucleoside polyphosphate hydrolase|nr:RNA pyrophosphohydrolase [Candidatus Puniceispirillum sp.]MBL6673831.1 RNA pyrophosphohydrolase [Candidatus Puniceispirillum sp.]MDB2528481.1 RNA pyrophosphohydrolase [Alphaproteobacteria bacterium]|tara:strand:- start:405 stop:902 length:498 start_codon:yes stop_codon:yes gene_type:complete
MNQTPSLPTAPYEQRPYRPCVGIFLLNNDGLVFAGRRIDSRAEAWQMPQGGIDAGESPLQACMREMREEIGTNTAELVSQHDDWLYYDIPLPLADRLWQGRYKGQKQKWMALRFTGDDSDINIATEEPEFCEWKWLSPHDLVDLAVPFKRDVYQNVLAAFAPYLK